MRKGSIQPQNTVERCSVIIQINAHIYGLCTINAGHRTWARQSIGPGQLCFLKNKARTAVVRDRSHAIHCRQQTNGHQVRFDLYGGTVIYFLSSTLW